MVAATKTGSRVHAEALRTSTRLTGLYYDMYRPGISHVNARKVVKLLREADIRFILMGTHGIGGWRSEARATQDVDLLVTKKDHAKAVRVLREAFPKLSVTDTPVVTRFMNPKTGKPEIDLMKSMQQVFQIAFRHTILVEESHRVPNLEMALVSKFAAMVSPNRDRDKKVIDIGDFMNIVKHNRADLDLGRLQKLADKVYAGGSKEILELVDNILEGRPIQV